MYHAGKLRVHSNVRVLIDDAPDYGDLCVEVSLPDLAGMEIAAVHRMQRAAACPTPAASTHKRSTRRDDDAKTPPPPSKVIYLSQTQQIKRGEDDKRVA